MNRSLSLLSLFHFSFELLSSFNSHVLRTKKLCTINISLRFLISFLYLLASLFCFICALFLSFTQFLWCAVCLCLSVNFFCISMLKNTMTMNFLRVDTRQVSLENIKVQSWNHSLDRLCNAMKPLYWLFLDFKTV